MNINYLINESVSIGKEHDIWDLKRYDALKRVDIEDRIHTADEGHYGAREIHAINHGYFTVRDDKDLVTITIAMFNKINEVRIDKESIDKIAKAMK